LPWPISSWLSEPGTPPATASWKRRTTSTPSVGYRSSSYR
jgi:hypothetical protein